jgi:hypothetical protein
MNKFFGITEEKGLFADVPQQPPAGKIQYYIELTDSHGKQTIMKESPLVIRYKGGVPGYILGPHILIMFMAMLFSTATGLLAIAKVPSFRKYGIGTCPSHCRRYDVRPVVQKLHSGIMDKCHWLNLTDNKTLVLSCSGCLRSDEPEKETFISILALLFC